MSTIYRIKPAEGELAHSSLYHDLAIYREVFVTSVAENTDTMCLEFNIKCTVYIGQWAVLSVQWTVFSVQWWLIRKVRNLSNSGEVI